MLTWEVIVDKIEMVSIPKKEYWKLRERDEYLESLEQAGVDNWDGCDLAYDIREEWVKEDADNDITS
tara:strand:- start:929 stop:1129 length:201 start_codon:yes stop_codon:yes gene_type:complete